MFIHRVLVKELVLHQAGEPPEFGQETPKQIQLVHPAQNMPHRAGLIENFHECLMDMRVDAQFAIHAPGIVADQLRQIRMQPHAVALQ